MAAKDTEVIVIDDPAEDEEEDTKGTVNSNEGKLLQLPITRVKTIMKSSPDIGPVSQEAYFLIAKCAELFSQYFASEAFKLEKDNKSLNYKSLASIVEKDESLDFLAGIFLKSPSTMLSSKDMVIYGWSGTETLVCFNHGEIVPQKIKMKDYWEMMKQQQEE